MKQNMEHNALTLLDLNPDCLILITDKLSHNDRQIFRCVVSILAKSINRQELILQQYIPLHILRLTLKNHDVNETVLNRVVSAGNLENVQWMVQNGYPVDATTFATAALSGSIKLMKWLYDYCCSLGYSGRLPWDSRTFMNAAEYGNLDNMIWLKETGCPLTDDEYGTDFIFAKAVMHGNLENMEWLKENGCLITRITMMYAVRKGNIEILQWLKKTGAPWGYYMFSEAAYAGKVDILEWLKQDGCEMTTDIYPDYVSGGAAYNGNLDVLKWVKDNNFQFGCFTYYFPLQQGNIDVLEWLKTNGCSYDNIRDLFEESRPEELAWLTDNTYCPPNRDTLLGLQNSNHIKSWLWLHDNNMLVKDNDYFTAARILLKHNIIY
jgi:hypothetical protein